MNANSQEITVVCHVRAPLLLEPVDRQVETIRACEAEGAIDDLLLRSWPKEVTLNESTPHQEVLETYDRLQSWADRQGVDITPPFKRRSTTSQVTGTTTEVLVTPLLCLELYADDELVGVFPHSANDKTATTNEAIAELRTGALPTPLGGEPESPIEAAASGSCPACGSRLIDGQGLFACVDCEWTGTVSASGGYVRHSPDQNERESIEVEQ